MITFLNITFNNIVASKRFNLWVAILLISAVNFACNDKRKALEGVIYIESFTSAPKYKLMGKQIKLQNFIQKPLGFEIYDSLIVISDLGNPNGLLNIIRIDDASITPVITNGEGPTQLTSISSINITLEKKLIIHDLQSQTFIAATLDSLINNNFNQMKKQRIEGSVKKRDSDASPPLSLIMRANLYKNEMLICSKMAVDSLQFEVRDLDFRQMGIKFGKYPEFTSINNLDYPDDINDQLKNTFFYIKVLGNIYSSKITINGKKHKLIVTYPAANLIEIYNLTSLTLEKRMVGPGGHYPTKIYFKGGNGYPIKNSRYGHNEITTSDNYLYALYSGDKFENPDAFLCKFVHVIDLNTYELVAVLELDRKAHTIRYNQSNNMLYTLSMNEDNPIAFYPLPEHFE